MDKYTVFVSQQAYREIDGIYGYLRENFQSIETAEAIVELIEKAIFSLSEMPHRGSERKVGVYAYQGYRQIFVKNYTILYRIEQESNSVIILTVRYTPSDF